MKRWENKIAVVTGASSGIGAILIQELATAKIKVMALARRLDNMEEIRVSLPEEVRCYLNPIKCDVTKESDVQKVFDFIARRHGGIDILINCAGIYRDGNLLSLDVRTIKEIIDTNLMSVVYCTKEAFKSMQARNTVGHIILMNCCSGHKVPSVMNNSFNIYCPTKFALTAMNSIYKQEFKNMATKIKVTSINPSHVKTTLLPKGQLNENIPLLRPEDVSEAVFYALSTPPNVQITNIFLNAIE